MSETLYDRLGGEAAVDEAVDGFYIKVLADAKLAPFFSNKDMAKLRSDQRKFMTDAFKGEDKTEDKGLPGNPEVDIRKASVRLDQLLVEKKLETEHFELIVDHLISTLADLMASFALIEEVKAVLAKHRSDFEEETSRSEIEPLVKKRPRAHCCFCF